MATVGELLGAARDLRGESPRRDAEILLCHCLEKPRAWLYAWPEYEVDATSAERYLQMIDRRAEGEPIAYITGQREFWSLQLAVNEHTLIPRPETETLVEWALSLQLPGDASVLDLGTGSGAIALAVARERPGWHVMAVDNSIAALEVAAVNAASNDLARVCFLQSEWFSALSGRRFHLLLGNPPYVDAADEHLQQGDLRFEPRDALVAAERGLADLASLISEAPAHLEADGWLLLEHGFEQGEQVRRLLHERGFSAVATRRDLAGQERISGGCWHVE
jgi:release factor glutamine methyltransferase